MVEVRTMAQFGQRAYIVFEGRKADGAVFDESSDEDPLSFILGNAEVFPKIEEAVLEMTVGESRTVFLAQEDAYGTFRPELIEKVPLYVLPRSYELEKGMVIRINRDDQPFSSIARVIDVAEGMVHLDFNHPLAGEEFTYTITLIDVRDE
jgi:peptidylprolyl isomerase